MNTLRSEAAQTKSFHSRLPRHATYSLNENITRFEKRNTHHRNQHPSNQSCLLQRTKALELELRHIN